MIHLTGVSDRHFGEGGAYVLERLAPIAAEAGFSFEGNSDSLTVDGWKGTVDGLIDLLFYRRIDVFSASIQS